MTDCRTVGATGATNRGLFFDPATMSWAAPTVLGGIGLLQADSAQKAAGRASKANRDAAKFLLNLANEQKGYLADAISKGAFDPNARMREAVNMLTKSYGDSAELFGSATRIAGYRPGDTPLSAGLRTIAANYSKDLAGRAYTNQSAAITDLLQAYNLISTSAAGQAGNLYSQQAQLAANQQMQGMNGLAGALGLWAMMNPSKEKDKGTTAKA